MASIVGQFFAIIRIAKSLNLANRVGSGVEKLSLRLPPTKVPAKETTYMCHAVALPQDDDYHIIATTPILVNPSLIHHIIIYMCDTFNEAG